MTSLISDEITKDLHLYPWLQSVLIGLVVSVCDDYVLFHS